jgi:hypothetical protein
MEQGVELAGLPAYTTADPFAQLEHATNYIVTQMHSCVAL